MKKAKLSLKAKVLISFLSLIFSVLFAFLYGAYTFSRLERRMVLVNDLYVPSLKALNQMESTFYLLESDLDKAFQEGIMRPKDTLERVMRSRMEYLDGLLRERVQVDPYLEGELVTLNEKFVSLVRTLDKTYDDWLKKNLYEAELSQHRSEFRMRIKEFSRDLERKIRLSSIGVQDDFSRLGITLTIVIACCFIAAFLLSHWLANALRPLEQLALLVRRISETGLNESIVRDLAKLPQEGDEIATLSGESLKMAISLLDKNKLLEDQKRNIERAHYNLAEQNIELRKTQAKLLHSEKLALVGKMAAQLAHEVRNPLNALNLHAELLEDQLRTQPKSHESLKLLQKEINRLINITENYLDIAKAPKLYPPERVQLNEVVEEMRDLYTPLLKEKGIFFTCDLGDIPPIFVDKPQISQVISNLLKNAAEALEEVDKSGKFIRLITQYQPQSAEVIVSIMDNGVGIAEEMQTDIFSPFVTTKAQGTGLGLAFSRQVVEAFGGEIYFDTTFKSGTKFTLRFSGNTV